MTATTLIAVKPDHVPDSLVLDFDFVAERRDDVRCQAGLAKVFERAGPIVWTPHYGGWWLVGSYDAVLDLAQDAETFSSDNTKYPPERHFQRNLPLATDAPEHAGYRAPLVRAMTPPTIAAMEPEIRAFAKSLVAGFAANGHCEAVSQYTELVPITVVLKLVGLPTDRIHEWRSLMPRILVAATTEEREQVKDEIRAIVVPFIEERKRERQKDLISLLLDSEFEGRRFTDAEMCAYLTTLFTAGLETVTSTMTFALHHLATHQDLQSKLRADPSLIPTAIEELLRRYSVVSFRRYVMRDVTFHGVQMKKYDRVAYMLGAANLDPKVFACPMAVDIDREDAPHLGFFAGPHRCPGSHLARAEMAIAHEEILSGLPPFRLDPAETIEHNIGWTMALNTLPLLWTPPAGA